MIRITEWLLPRAQAGSKIVVCAECDMAQVEKERKCSWCGGEFTQRYSWCSGLPETATNRDWCMEAVAELKRNGRRHARIKPSQRRNNGKQKEEYIAVFV